MVIPGSTPPHSRSVKAAAVKELAWKERRSLIQKLLIQSACWALLFFFTTTYFGLGLRVSRRLANLPYVLWVNAFNNAQLLLFCLVETLYFPRSYQVQESVGIDSSTSKIMQSFNKHGLAVFLVANLLTGMINLCLRTLDMSSLSAMGVLMGYAASVTGVAFLLDHTGVKIKL